MLTSSAHVYVAKLWLMIRSWDASFKEDSAVLPGRASCWNSRSSSWKLDDGAHLGVVKVIFEIMLRT